MSTFIKAGFWQTLCKTCKGYEGWLNLDEYIKSFIHPDGNTLYYGSFYDTTTQSVAKNGTKAMELNSTDPTATYGFTIENNLLGRPTRITAQYDGVYNLAFSAQINRTSGGNDAHIHIWPAINENAIPWSSTGLLVKANATKLVAAWNFFVKMSAGDYVELMWTQDDLVQILAETGDPSIPSLILTMNKVN